MAERILIVEDNAEVRSTLERVLLGDGYEVHAVDDGSEAIALLGVVQFSVCITDMRLPGASGEEILASIQSLRQRPEVVVLTGYPEVPVAVRSMRAGAFDYIQKPIEPSELQRVVRHAVSRHHLVSRTKLLEEALESHQSGLIGVSPAMVQVRHAVERVAPMPVNVLLTGETGTGKDVAAREIHRLYGRGEFVAVNCGAIPGDLLESELFGVARGAFTGATADRPGLLELATGGTLFLDEIGDMPLPLQVKLNRALESGTVRRLGEGAERPVNFRVLAATNRDLKQAASTGAFRSDLYYRLRVVEIQLPALRDRPGDVALLAARFLQLSAVRFGGRARRLSPDGLAVLEAHPWPGNVRELRNMMEGIAVMTEGEVVERHDLPADLRGSLGMRVEGGSFRDHVERARRVASLLYLTDLLRRHRGNVTQAAQDAGMDRVSLHRVLREHNLNAAAFRQGGA